MSRFNDDLYGISDHPEWRPYSSIQLIGKLGIGGLPLAKQRSAIADWLTDNEPAPKLLTSLRSDGLIDSPHHSAA